MQFKFKVDRLQIIVVAKKYMYVSQLFISRMPKMHAMPQSSKVEANQNTAFLQKNRFKTKTQARKAVWVNMGLNDQFLFECVL